MSIQEIVEEIKKMDAVQLNDLSKAIQEAFGLEPGMMMAPLAAASGPAAAGPAAEQEQTEFTLILTSSGDKKVQVIKTVKDILGIKLAEAKEIVDKAPVPIKEHIPEDEANRLRERLLEVGASVEIK